jgi:hypothetical protein
MLSSQCPGAQFWGELNSALPLEIPSRNLLKSSCTFCTSLLLAGASQLPCLISTQTQMRLKVWSIDWAWFRVCCWPRTRLWASLGSIGHMSTGRSGSKNSYSSWGHRIPKAAGQGDRMMQDCPKCVCVWERVCVGGKGCQNFTKEAFKDCKPKCTTFYVTGDQQDSSLL